MKGGFVLYRTLLAALLLLGCGEETGGKQQAPDDTVADLANGDVLDSRGQADATELSTTPDTVTENETPCTPDCGGRLCGDDGCGGSCGTCPSWESCQGGGCAAREVLVPAGSFWMGCNEAVDADCEFDEYPYHEVYLDAFYIDVAEVTVDEYKQCSDAGVCRTHIEESPYCYSENPGMGNYPRNCVTWVDAVAYCQWRLKRLPTEAEWEKAARGLDGRKFPWGNEAATCELANMSFDWDFGCGTDMTSPVCSRSPAGDSPFGLCDMAGNVAEYTTDYYWEEYYAVSEARNPTGPDDNAGHKVIRGEGFAYGELSGPRTSNRAEADTGNRIIFVGFRCVRPAGDGSE